MRWGLEGFERRGGLSMLLYYRGELLLLRILIIAPLMTAQHEPHGKGGWRRRSEDRLDESPPITEVVS